MTSISAASGPTMRAIVHRRYGGPDVLRLETVPVPRLGDDGILVRVQAVSLNAFDWHILRGEPYLVRTEAGFHRPKRAIAGVDLAGTVEAVGRGVSGFAPGDEVFGERGGALAELVAGKPDSFSRKPVNLTFEQAAAVPMAGFTALQALRDKGRVEPGQRVLVMGAGGGVGTFAVQLAKALGAHVTGVTHTRNVELVGSIGADEVIDYTGQDVTRGSGRFDLILDIGASSSLLAGRRILNPNGALVVVGAPRGNWFAPVRRPLTAVVLSRFGSRRLLPFLAERRLDDLVLLRELIEAGRVTPVIDRTYRLEEAAEAFRRLESGQVQGKVVITI